uniref:Uncharacterized protein n=1 Tax=Eptatretus burgeri TaxID=7764 RepID=A0A8C4NFL9_EPTBU
VALNTTIDLQDKKKVSTFNKKRHYTHSGRSRPIKILTRLTAIISDHSHGNKLVAPCAVVQHCRCVQMACNDLEVDIICIDTSQKLPFRMRHPLTNLAVQRGIYFEITYAAGLCDPTMRRYLIANAITLTQICKGRVSVFVSLLDGTITLWLSSWEDKLMIYF